MKSLRFPLAALAVVALGFALGCAIPAPESHTVRVLRMGAALEQSGATSPHFEHVAALIDAGRLDEAEAIARKSRLTP